MRAIFIEIPSRRLALAGVSMARFAEHSYAISRNTTLLSGISMRCAYALRVTREAQCGVGCGEAL
jgi:hypothetical protein